MKKFEVGKTYEAVRGNYYHCQVVVTKRTSCCVTFQLNEKMQRYFNFNTPEVRRRYKVVDDQEVATLSGTSTLSDQNWVVCAYNEVQ